MTEPWKIWFMRPEWLERGRFYDEKPDPWRLGVTHEYVGFVADGVPDMHILRDYKEFVFNQFSPRRPQPGGLRRMAWGDVMVSPKGDVWTVQLWGFEFIGPDPAPRLHSPMYTVEDVRRMTGNHPAIRLHHQAPGAPKPGEAPLDSLSRDLRQ